MSKPSARFRFYFLPIVLAASVAAGGCGVSGSPNNTSTSGGGSSGGGGGSNSAGVLTPSSTTLSFGSVYVDSSMAQPLTLTNTGNASLTISNVSVSGAGFSGTGVTNGTVLAAGQSATLTVTFAPTAGGAVSAASVSLASNATTSPVNVGLSGTGEHSVVLTWNASPTNSVTYNVFRGTSSGGEGTSAINPSPISALTYTDTSVSAGTNYYYTVKAVDSGGTSAPSNEAPADVPNP